MVFTLEIAFPSKSKREREWLYRYNEDDSMGGLLIIDSEIDIRNIKLQ